MNSSELVRVLKSTDTEILKSICIVGRVNQNRGEPMSERLARAKQLLTDASWEIDQEIKRIENDTL